MIGNKVCFFETLNSTNTYMKEHLEDFRDGDIICARKQTSGRGRREKNWISFDGNLHFSFLVKNEDNKDLAFDLIMMVSNVMCKVLKKYGIKAHIKYPNDIIVKSRKIAGILIERMVGEEDCYVVGVGLNVSTEDFDSLSHIATSIYLESNNQLDYRDVLWQFIKIYNETINCKHCNLYEEYHNNSIVLGRNISISGESFLVKDINLFGELILMREGKEYIRQLSEVTLKEFYSE